MTIAYHRHIKWLATLLLAALAAHGPIVGAMFVSVKWMSDLIRFVVSHNPFLSLLLTIIRLKQPSANGLRQRSDGNMEEPCKCMLVKLDVLHLNGITSSSALEVDNDGWRCVDTDETGSPIINSLDDLPPDILEELNASNSATTYLHISSAIKIISETRNVIRIHSKATVSLSRAEVSRDLQQLRLGVGQQDTIGNHTLVVVRVIDEAGDQPTADARQLSDDVFGTYKDPHNLVSTCLLSSLTETYSCSMFETHTLWSIILSFIHRDPSILLAPAEN